MAPPPASPSAPPAAALPPVQPVAPPAPLHAAPGHGKTSTEAVPPNGPKHRRHSVAESGAWLVQAGAYHSQDRAQLVADTLVKHGWKARVVQGHDNWVLVEITGYKTRADADAAATKLAAKEKVPTLVRRVPQKPGADAPH
jgi:cell division protein FtsN